MSDAQYDLVVRGGKVWTGDQLSEVDLAVSDGRIAAIGPGLGAGAAELDAAGKLVLPGGIDVHTHFETEVGGEATADGYESGTRAAAFGGLTSIINYAVQNRGERLRDVVAREQSKAAGQSYLDYGFHLILTDLTAPDVAADLLALPDLGCPSVKVFTALGFRLTDPELLSVLSQLSGKGVLVNVHAEDGPLIDFLSEQLQTAGATGIDQLGASRPPRVEALAAEKMLSYAGAAGTPLYIVHLSSEEAMDAVRRARRSGIEVYVETRPAYLFLDDAVYRLPDREGNRFACWPPLRSKSDQAALWQALADGEIQCYATDHTTWSLAQKMRPDLPFEQVPGGISNVQTSMGMLYSEGVVTGRLSLQRFVEVASQTPAQLFGLWPRKGCIAVGSDADLMVLDPDLRYRVVSENMQSASDFDPYDGYVSTGWPVATILRGQLLMRDQELQSTPEAGSFLHRAPFSTPA